MQTWHSSTRAAADAQLSVCILAHRTGFHVSLSLQSRASPACTRTTKLRSVLVSARQKGSRTRRLVFAEIGEDENEDAEDAEDGAAEDADVSLDGIGGIMEEDDPPGHKSGEPPPGHSLRSTLQCVTLQWDSKAST